MNAIEKTLIKTGAIIYDIGKIINDWIICPRSVEDFMGLFCLAVAEFLAWILVAVFTMMLYDKSFMQSLWVLGIINIFVSFCLGIYIWTKWAKTNEGATFVTPSANKMLSSHLESLAAENRNLGGLMSFSSSISSFEDTTENKIESDKPTDTKIEESVSKNTKINSISNLEV